MGRMSYPYKLPATVIKEERQLKWLEQLTRKEPKKAVESFAQLVASAKESDRRTAATCIDLLMTSPYREDALKLWHLLMGDPEVWVRNIANDVLLEAYDRGDEWPSPNGVSLSQDEAASLAWTNYLTSVSAANLKLGDPDPNGITPCGYSEEAWKKGEKTETGNRASTAHHDNVLLHYFLGLERKGTYRERCAFACGQGSVSYRYLLKHQYRLLWLLAVRMADNRRFKEML
ncbi:MAG TPA: hypothetical protein VFO38_00575 [Candidatus Saccharimonadales bacterium]|nr:hypothetical protein [Candidatus Saccharimonadales bacterium]